MLNRDQIMNLVGTMDDNQLIDMLKIVGINIQQQGGAPEDVTEGIDGIESWNDMKIKTGDDNRPDSLFDISQFTVPKNQGTQLEQPTYDEPNQTIANWQGQG